MPIYLVAYDLNNPGQNYERITQTLKGFAHCHAQGSVWFVEAKGPTTALRDALAAVLDANDKLFVDEVSGAWAGKSMPVCGKWLNDRGL
ncbi:hypothetical protein [Paracoccus lutimaris]|uniref:hypothetical protein n=1 Tax=Paracoccus lutimaris TaxID=1490030 RepID=UPI0011C048C6|nr:hypothetical protein [Paracoccus lutimaris]